MATRILLAFVTCASSLLTGCASEVDCPRTNVCTSSPSGFEVAFSKPLREPGTYEFELEVAGAGVSMCSYTLTPETTIANELVQCTPGLAVRSELATEQPGQPPEGIAVLHSMSPISGIRGLSTNRDGAPLMLRVKRNEMLLVEQSSLSVTEVNTRREGCEPCFWRVVNLSMP